MLDQMYEGTPFFFGNDVYLFLRVKIIFIESGGDNLSATFSPELADATIFVIDVAEGDKIPRKGGPGIDPDS